MSDWQPIDSCPYYKNVLLWFPEGTFPGWTDFAWVGRRSGGDSRNLGYDEKFSVVTPFADTASGYNKQVLVDMENKWPTHWMPMPAAPTGATP